jgi:hypothetical protein
MNTLIGKPVAPQPTLLAYSAPSLQLVGDMRDLTASGSGVDMETTTGNGGCSNASNKSKC